MSNNIKKILADIDSVRFATDTGTRMHARLGRVVVDGDNSHGDQELINQICSVPGLAQFFTANSMCEVPIAGNIGNRFVSRRIDRLTIDVAGRRIDVLDYKTDINPDVFRNNYIAQLHEYAALLHQIYPDYKINTYILWTHQWRLERV